jgi:hypothetical protein
VLVFEDEDGERPSDTQLNIFDSDEDGGGVIFGDGGNDVLWN